MKKVLALIAATALSGGLNADNISTFYVDSIEILQKSIEGKELAKKIQKDIDAFEAEVKQAQEELKAEQTSLQKQAALLSAEALQEKTESLTNKKKKYEREFADKEEALRQKTGKQQLALRQKQLVVFNAVREKEGWDELKDVNSPGLLSVADKLIKTEYVLQKVDEKYQSDKAKPAQKQAAAKAAPAAKSTTQSAAKPAARPEIKVV